MARKLPPSIHDLLGLDEFKAMMRKNPWLPDSMRWGNPWRLWAQKDDGTWVMREYPTYADVWRVSLKAIRSGNYADVSIVSKRYLMAPSKELRKVLDFMHPTFPWCPRCRRPTYYGAFTAKHHALKLQPALTEDLPFRCYYCGIRRSMIWDFV